MDQLASEISPESLATLLPDLPRWLEARLAEKLGFEAMNTVVVFSRAVTQTSVDFE
jgi:hypothetical protein